MRTAAAPTTAEPSRHEPDPLVPSNPYRALAALARPTIRILFRPTATGLERLPAGGFVLSSNQLSNLDGFALANPMYPRQVQWMGKAELFKGPLGALLRKRSNGHSGRARGSWAQVDYAVEAEGALTVADIVARRTTLETRGLASNPMREAIAVHAFARTAALVAR